MIKLFASVCIDAPEELVWERLAKLEDIQLWSEQIITARCQGPVHQGVGAERICELRGNLIIREHWTGWDEGKSFKYEGYGVPLMKRVTNLWTVNAEGKQTLLTSEAELVIKGGLFGRILEPLMAPLMRRIAPNALAAFKYLVEHGKPYEGKHSKLPRAAVIC